MSKCCDSLASKLKRRVTIESVLQADDGQGGFEEIWATEATVWASIEPMKGYERFQAAQMQTPVTHKVMMRYRSGVTTKKRLKYEGRTFEIKEVLNVDEEKVLLKLTCLEL